MRTNLPRLIQSALCIFLLFSATQARAASPPPEFTFLESFPSAPAQGAFYIAAGVLGDGRFVLYDGLNILVEDVVHAGTYTTLATDYPGDPAFIAVAPDGFTVLIGGGFTDPGLFLIDTQTPVDGSEPLLDFDGHFSAVFLSADLILVDYAVLVDPETFQFEARLAIVDLGATPPVIRDVVTGTRGASAAVSIDSQRGRTYATDGLNGETRSFTIQSLLDAFSSNTPLSWDDGTLIGTFNTQGVFGVSRRGTLLIGGADPLTFEGFVVFVDPETGEVAGTVDPTGNMFTFYSGAYNSVTGRVLIVGADFPGPMISGFISTRPYEHLLFGPGDPGARAYFLLLLWGWLLRRWLQQVFAPLR